MKKVKDIAIFGAGGFGREVACLLRKINAVEPTWNFVGFYDDGLEKGSRVDYGEILGGIADLNVVAAPSAWWWRWAIPKRSKLWWEKSPTIILISQISSSPDVALLDSDNFRMGKGNVVSMGNFFSCNVSMGDFNTFVLYGTVGHDCTFGNFNCLMPGTRISGNVTIGDVNLFGSNSVVIQGKTIGDNTTVAAGSVVMTNLKDGHTYMGCPAKKVF